MLKPLDGDFRIHRETGRRFLAGEFLYTNGHDFPYPPFLGLFFAPAACFPVPVAKALYYPLGVAALLLLCWLVRRLVLPAFRLDASALFWTSALALFLANQFVIRDQAELGFNTIVIALVWTAVYLWIRGRDLYAALGLGAAIAIKCTPVIFLGYFVWKRQWRMAIYTVVTTLLFTLSPMVRLGMSSWTDHMRVWSGNAMRGIVGNTSDAEAVEILRPTNMALRPALLPYLSRIPAAPNDWHHDPPRVKFLALPLNAARVIVNLVLAALVAWFLWLSRHRVTSRNDPALLWQLSAAGILMVLLSPITWMQHCVALLPACFLVAALLITRRRLPIWCIVVVGLFVVFCSILGRDLLPRELGLALTSLRLTTLCICGIFAITMFGYKLQPKTHLY